MAHRIDWIPPQLATLSTVAPDGDDWIHEIKFDGYRLLAWVDGPAVRLFTRNRKDWTERFPAVAEALSDLDLEDCVLDGEVAVETESGVTSFQALQNVLVDSSRGALKFFVFDALRVSGKDVRRLPLLERKDLARTVIGPDSAVVRYSDHILGNGPKVFERACGHGLEGIISKRVSAPYRSGRSTDWLKVKCVREQEFVIGGFTEPAGSRAGLGALHVGAWEGDRLIYRGKVGTGFSDALLRDLRRQLDKLEREKSPFTNGPRGAAARAAHWVEPRLVAQIRFTDITDDGRLRHPAFEGLREDKSAAEVVMEKPRAAPGAKSRAGAKTGAKSRTAAAGSTSAKPRSRKAATRRSDARAQPARKAVATPGKRGPDAKAKPSVRKPAGKKSARESPASDATKPSKMQPAAKSRAAGAKGAAVQIGEVRLTSPDKVLYPEQGLTKLDLANYYRMVADWILPHISGRPLTLVRCPSGRGGWCFFQKHIDDSAPAALHRVRVEERDGPEWYGYVDSVDGLVSLAQIGALELHTFNVRQDRLEKPDRFLIDLDPDEGVEWDQIAAAAVHVRDLLDELGLRSFLKTTGGKGLHVVVPLTRRAEWEEVRVFSRAVASLLVEVAPDLYTVEMSKKKRRGRVLLDYMRNTRGATAIEAYSTRAREGAPVAVPIGWEELDAGVRPNSFTVENLEARLRSLREDPWKDFGAVKQSLTAPMKRRLGL